MRTGRVPIFLVFLFLAGCAAQDAGSASIPAQPPSTDASNPASTLPGAATSTPKSISATVPVSTPTLTETVAPTEIPLPPVLDLKNITQIVQLHDYTPEFVSYTGLAKRDFNPFSPVFSPDGKSFASAVALPDSKRAIYILDIATGDLVSRIPMEDAVTGVFSWAFSPDGGKLLYSTYPDGKITIWDIAAGKVDKVLYHHKGFAVSDVAVTLDGKQITAVVGDANNNGLGDKLTIWDAASGQMKAQLPADTQYGVDICRYSADGSRLVVTSSGGGKVLSVYETATWKLLSRIIPAGGAERAAISPDGAIVITGRESGATLLIWDAGTGKLISTLKTPFDSVTTIEYSPDGSMLVVSGISPFKPKTDNMYIHGAIWDTSTWTQTGILYWNVFNSFRFAPDGKSILAQGDQAIRLVGMPDKETLAADQAAADFTALLGSGDYAAAAPLFYFPQGTRDYLKSKGLNNNPAAVLEAVCKSGAYPCYKATAVYTSRDPGDARGSVLDYWLYVRFTKPDGSIYADKNGATVFDLIVNPAADGSYQFDFLVDYEAALKSSK